MSLSRIFNKLKDHFWNKPEMKGGLPYVLKNQTKMEVDIEVEHMALFFHDIMKDQAIYKIMKSAQQTLDDDRATLKEYVVFKQIIMTYKRVYAYCKQCYKKALIRQKFEDPPQIGAKAGDQLRGQPGAKYCNNRDCRNCYPRAQAEAAKQEETQHLEEEKISTCPCDL